MTLDDRSKAFRDLRAAITALTPHLADPGAVEELAALAAAIEGLEHPSASPESLAADTPDQLLDLLKMAGPEVAPKLLLQLAQDLTQCQDSLTQTTDSDADWLAWRNSSHVVISLAGSVGALALQSLAERLNSAAHRQDRTEAMRLLPQVRQALSALIQRIETTVPPAPAPDKIVPVKNVPDKTVPDKTGGHR